MSGVNFNPSYQMNVIIKYYKTVHVKNMDIRLFRLVEENKKPSGTMSFFGGADSEEEYVNKYFEQFCFRFVGDSMETGTFTADFVTDDEVLKVILKNLSNRKWSKEFNKEFIEAVNLKNEFNDLVISNLGQRVGNLYHKVSSDGEKEYDLYFKEV